MKHYFIFLQTKNKFIKYYEMWSDSNTAYQFKLALEKQYNCYLTLCEVISNV